MDDEGQLDSGAQSARGRPSSVDDFLVGGGQMAKFIRGFDWSKTALGPIDSWPQSLRTTVSLVQASNSPISLSWGRGHVQIYNDGYWPICGAKHPGSMGQDFRECWASAFPVIGDAYRSAWAGRSAYLEKMRMFLDRRGALEETCFTFSFSPITDESGRIGGLFHPVTELTGQMLSERRTRALHDLASRTGRARSAAEALALSVAAFADDDLDLPFVLLYVVGDDLVARLAAQSGLDVRADAAPATIECREPGDSPWNVARAVHGRGSQGVEDAARLLGGRAVGPYPECPQKALAIPILQLGSERPAAVMVAGVSSRLVLDDPYRAFFELAAAGVGAALANARGYEEQRARAEALAEIDRAKTAFFSNVSHEFRTPLTLILGPLEDALGAPHPALEGESLKTVHRSAQRLLRLVNSLLDFSRIEAGRLESHFEATDLGELTAGLASSFTSMVEGAGLELVVDCPSDPEPAYVDRAHWEKIVLNLVSNAFKFTFEGRIVVALHRRDGALELSVSDTGTGIPAKDLPRLFERFQRVEGARGRSFEGTGIGLALVAELAKEHGGTVRVVSAVGRGSTFTVTIPSGCEHLPQDRVGPAGARRAPSLSPVAIEAAQWSRTPSSRSALAVKAARVLVADDNTDMREYLERLLSPEWDVVAVADGEAALAAAREHPPDLVLSDVMMPRLDGEGLLRALRADPRLASIPVVLLSARAGEEAVLHGLETGADDYLVKPFSARELLTRVKTHLSLGVLRRAAAESAKRLADTRADLLRDVERKNKELEAFSYSVSHDLRAPLRSIDGFSQAILEDYGDRLDDTAHDYLRRVRGSAQRMGQLIDDMLMLARVERVAMARESVDLSQMATWVGDALAKAEHGRQVNLVVDPAMTIVADPRLFLIVVENLMSNAWKFTAKTSEARVEVGSLVRDGQRVYFVRDNGAGFNPAYLAKLFGAFQRLHTEAEFPGTGVGLATVQRIVRRHGGEVWAEGQTGQGATLYFTVPNAGGEGTS
jgi:signal transduction histidine kinase